MDMEMRFDCKKKSQHKIYLCPEFENLRNDQKPLAPDSFKTAG